MPIVMILLANVIQRHPRIPSGTQYANYTLAYDAFGGILRAVLASTANETTKRGR